MAITAESLSKYVPVCMFLFPSPYILFLTVQLSLKEAERWANKRQPKKAVPFLQKALKDPHNLDADIQLAFFAPSKAECVEILGSAEGKGRIILKRALGEHCFDAGSAYMGAFWEQEVARPYLRVLQALVRMAYEADEITKSTSVCAFLFVWI